MEQIELLKTGIYAECHNERERRLCEISLDCLTRVSDYLNKSQTNWVWYEEQINGLFQSMYYLGMLKNPISAYELLEELKLDKYK